MFEWLKSKPKTDSSPTKLAGDEPLGEAEKLVTIKNLCWMAGMSGESISGASNTELQDEHMQYELTRFTRLQNEALGFARQLTDTFYRDAALHMLIDSYMKAGYELEAKKLYGIIEIDMIQDKVREAYPQLGAKF